MKTQTLGLLAILSLGVGLTSFSSTAMFQESTDIGTYGESSAISGHVTVIHRDAQGSILGYQQYDNVIVNEGLNCATETLFASGNATCAMASQTDQFDFIGLLGNTPDVQTEDNAAVGITRLTGGGLGIGVADDIGMDIVADAAGVAQDFSTTTIQKLFTKTNATAANIGGATLQTGADDAIFAAKAFTGGNLVLNESDTLEVTWSIQLG